MNNLRTFIELSDGDKRALIVTVIVIAILIAVIVAFGAAVRMVFNYQAAKADGMVGNAVRAHVIQNGKQEREFGFKKNARHFYRESLFPFLFSVLAGIVLLIAGIASGRWDRNIFQEFSDLFFQFDFSAEGVIVNFWGLKLIAAFPPVSHAPEFVLDHLFSYIAVSLFLVSWVWYFISAQGFVARLFRINYLARKNFDDNLENFNAHDDIKISADKPIPPTE